MTTQLTEKNPACLLVYPVAQSGGIVYLNVGCDMGECDVRVAIKRIPPNATNVQWVVNTYHISSKDDGNLSLKVDVDGSLYMRASVIISNITNADPVHGILVGAAICPDKTLVGTE